MRQVVLQIIAVLSISLFVFGQDQKADKWIRVQNDDGEFSIELPEKFAYFYNKEGFLVNNTYNSFLVEEMSMANAYVDKTLLSFETYKAKQSALDAITDSDEHSAKFLTKNADWSKLKKEGYKLKQLNYGNKNFTAIRQYFSSKNRIYVLTVANRDGETAAMKRFFDSLIFKPDAKNEQISEAIRFANLKQSEVEAITNAEPPKPPGNIFAKPTSDPNALPLVIVSQPIPSFTSSAKRSFETGNIQVRLTFSDEGRVSKVGIIKDLNAGLLRQSLFSAIRMKFLPAEKDGKPITVSKIVEYSFRIY